MLPSIGAVFVVEDLVDLKLALLRGKLASIAGIGALDRKRSSGSGSSPSVIFWSAGTAGIESLSDKPHAPKLMLGVLGLVVQLDSDLGVVAVRNQWRQDEPSRSSARLLMAGRRPTFAVVDLGIDGVGDREGSIVLLDVGKGVNDRNLDPLPIGERVGGFDRDLREHNVAVVWRRRLAAPGYR